jgi:hypothetical protein
MSGLTVDELPIGDIGLRGLAEPVALVRALIRDSSPAG